MQSKWNQEKVWESKKLGTTLLEKQITITLCGLSPSKERKPIWKLSYIRIVQSEVANMRIFKKIWIWHSSQINSLKHMSLVLVGKKATFVQWVYFD